MGSAASSNGWYFGFVRIGVVDGYGFTGSGFIAAQHCERFCVQVGVHVSCSKHP